MASVEAYGLSSSVATPLGQGQIQHYGQGLAAASSSAYGESHTSVEVLSVVAINSTKIRITFDTQMTSNDDLVDLDNYTIIPTGSGVTLYKSAAEAEDAVYPNYVDITVSEMTNGQTYQASVETGSGGPVDRLGLNVSPGNNSKTFVGVGVKPTISYVESTGQNSVKVVFSEAMEDNSALRNSSRYTFDNGLSVLAVTSVEPDAVYLSTSDQISGLLYTLTIT